MKNNYIDQNLCYYCEKNRRDQILYFDDVMKHKDCICPEFGYRTVYEVMMICFNVQMEFPNEVLRKYLKESSTNTLNRRRSV